MILIPEKTQRFHVSAFLNKNELDTLPRYYLLANMKSKMAENLIRKLVEECVTVESTEVNGYAPVFKLSMDCYVLSSKDMEDLIASIRAKAEQDALSWSRPMFGVEQEANNA